MSPSPIVSTVVSPLASCPDSASLGTSVVASLAEVALNQPCRRHRAGSVEANAHGIVFACRSQVNRRFRWLLSPRARRILLDPVSRLLFLTKSGGVVGVL
jgi:hypothetical protein